MSFECFDRVRGAAWIITAGWRQQRRERHLITANKQHEKSSHSELRRRDIRSDTGLNEQYIRTQTVDVRSIRLGSRANRDVDRRTGAQRGQETDAHELAQSALEPVAIDGGVFVTRNHDSNSRKCERGSEDAHVEVCCPNSLPLANDGLNVEAFRQSVTTRKAKTVVTRLRTCSGA
jgi:hypothetical protein